MIGLLGQSAGFGRSSAVRTGAMLFAGMILLVLNQPAMASFVTRNVNVTLNAANFESYNLDVDNNGTTDFTFSTGLFLDPMNPIASIGYDVVDFPFGTNNGVVIDGSVSNGFPTATRLVAGNTVSAANTFSTPAFDQGNLFFFTMLDPPSGNFEGRTGFLGLRFDSPSGTVFGFAQITVNSRTALVNPLGLTIGTVGYETVPGQPITIPVPEPGSALAMLIGLCGLAPAAWRYRRVL